MPWIKPIESQSFIHQGFSSDYLLDPGSATFQSYWEEASQSFIHQGFSSDPLPLATPLSQRFTGPFSVTSFFPHSSTPPTP
jgi:hypothetical protein